MQKWEYKRIIRTFNYETKEWKWNDGGKEIVDDKLCLLGLSGWELVSETALSMYSGEGWIGRTSDLTYVSNALSYNRFAKEIICKVTSNVEGTRIKVG